MVFNPLPHYQLYFFNSLNFGQIQEIQGLLALFHLAILTDHRNHAYISCDRIICYLTFNHPKYLHCRINGDFLSRINILIQLNKFKDVSKIQITIRGIWNTWINFSWFFFLVFWCSFRGVVKFDNTFFEKKKKKNRWTSA